MGKTAEISELVEEAKTRGVEMQDLAQLLEDIETIDNEVILREEDMLSDGN